MMFVILVVTVIVFSIMLWEQYCETERQIGFKEAYKEIKNLNLGLWVNLRLHNGGTVHGEIEALTVDVRTDYFLVRVNGESYPVYNIEVKEGGPVPEYYLDVCKF